MNHLPSPPSSLTTPACAIPLSSPEKSRNQDRSSTPLAPPTPPSDTDWGKRKPLIREAEDEGEEEEVQGSTKGGESQNTDDGEDHGAVSKSLSSSPPKATTCCEFAEDVGLSELLRSNDLGKYVPIFIEHEVDLKAFCNLKESHLMEMGLHKVGTRVKVTTLIAEYSEVEARNKQQQQLQQQLQQHLQLQASPPLQQLQTPPPPLPLQQLQPQQQLPTVGSGILPLNKAGSPVSNNGPVITERSKSRPGEIPFEELVFQECIGRGSFGSVFKGLWGDQCVAIKKVLGPCAREAEVMSKVRHRHVIQCFGACNAAPNFCLVMELAIRSLKQAIYDPNTTTDPGLVIDWCSQIASGMNYLHTEAPVAIIHRDLKPGNVLITSDGILKVSDFGLSRTRISNMTDKMSSVGTFEYMAPEIIRNEPYNEKVDVYSFGVVAWEMLTRKMPYAGLPPLSVAFGIGSGTLSLPFPSSCPESITTIIGVCLERKHGKRPSFKELMFALDALKDSDFASVSQLEYAKLQKSWQTELGLVFETFKKEMDTLKQKQKELSKVESTLEEREKRVKEREDNLANTLLMTFSCRHTLKKYTEDTIGIGLSAARDECNRMTKVEFVAEYLSATAFFDLNVRYSSNHDLQFQCFLPLYLSAEHFDQAKNMAEDAILCMVTGMTQNKIPHPPCSKDKKKRQTRCRFHPDMALMVLGSLLNEALSYAVNEKLHLFKALETFCLFHRLLLSFAARYSITTETCDRQISDFISSENERSESEFPVLGEFLSLFVLSELPWARAVESVVDEVFQRGWRLTLARYPQFENTLCDSHHPEGTITWDGVSDEELLEKAFETMLPNLRLVMLHYAFLTNVSHMEGMDPKQIADQYDEQLGQAIAKMKEKIEGAFKAILAVSSIAGFLQYVGYSHLLRGEAETVVTLKKSINRGILRSYY